jgi:hypothetical protein
VGSRAEPSIRPAKLVAAVRPELAASREPAPDPLAPRLRPKGAPPERSVRDRELKKRKARVADLEARIAAKEQGIKDIEARMALPGFYDDRTGAEKAAAEHQALMWEVGDLMSQWEALQGELEAAASS